MSNDDEYIDGVKIQKLPTYGRPYDNKNRKWRGSYTNIEMRHGSKTAKKLLKIARILAKKD